MEEEYVATGRRKTAVASVRLRPGTGKFLINGKPMDQYLPLDIQKEKVVSPFQHSGGYEANDVVIRVKGGGIEGQIIAIRLGISRALVMRNESLKEPLKSIGFLTRDPRKRERKKYGRAGARKRFQFSKR